MADEEECVCFRFNFCPSIRFGYTDGRLVLDANSRGFPRTNHLKVAYEKYEFVCVCVRTVLPRIARSKKATKRVKFCVGRRK